MADLPDWPYWKVVSITGQAGAGTDYQVKLTIGDSAGGDFHLEGHCTNFPQDIRITDNDGTTLLGHWVEDLTADPIVVHVKVKDDLGSNRDIRVYYGKSGETTASNGDNTFPFFDDFNSWDPGKWTGAYTSITGGIIKLVQQEIKSIDTFTYGNIVSIYAKPSNHTDDSSQTELGFGSYYESNAVTLRVYGKPGRPKQISTRTINSGSQTITLRLNDWSEVYKLHTSKIVSSSSSFFEYDGNTWAQTTNVPTTAIPVMIKARPDKPETIEIDYLYVRKYNSPEPAFCSAGAEQTSGLVPVFIRHNPALTGGMV